MAFLSEINGDLIARAERTGIKAARALRLNCAGVDIMLHPEKQEPVVIEVNAFPGFPKVRTFNLGRHLMTGIGKRRWK
jgi:D-alanine-D-alanine ligase-like ATP-grasp enzyme